MKGLLKKRLIITQASNKVYCNDCCDLFNYGLCKFWICVYF